MTDDNPKYSGLTSTTTDDNPKHLQLTKNIIINSKNMGNRAKVMDRWYGGRTNGRYKQTPHPPFIGEPQFTFKELYIPQFTHKLVTDEYGRSSYQPLERNFTPSGIRVLDDYLQALNRGCTDVSDFCKRYNARTADLDGLIFFLLGMPNLEFRNRWIMHNADLLLRYTDMKIDEVARRSGAGTRTNLYFMYERDLNTSPTERRNDIQKKGDVGKYKIEESNT